MLAVQPPGIRSRYTRHQRARRKTKSLNAGYHLDALTDEPNGWRKRWRSDLFNVVNRGDDDGTRVREQSAWFLRIRMWGINPDERHSDALAPGDLVLLYLGAPDREFVGHAELASAVHAWTPSEARVYPGDFPVGVLLAEVEEWIPPVPMSTVLSQIDPAENAKADFQTGVVRITASEYETALAVAASRAPSSG